MTRGEYRSFHTVLLDGPDFQQLAPEVRWLYMVCRMSVGASGMDVVPGMLAALAERSGLTEDRVRAGLAVLRDGGWVEVEGNVLWVVRGLEFEPSLKAKNAKHRQGLAAHLDGLPRLPIVARFRTRYAAWFDAPDTHPGAMPMPSGGHAEAMPIKGRGKREKGEGIPPGNGIPDGGPDDGLPDDVRDALVPYTRPARFPLAITAAVAALLNPEARPSYTAAEVVRALREMQAQGKDFAAPRLAAWCANNRKRREDIVLETDDCGVMCRWRVEPDGTKTKLGVAA